MADYSQKTEELIERMCRNVEREDFVLDKSKAEELILRTYDLFNLPRPKNIVWCKDIFDKNFQRSTRSAGSTRSARSAESAGSTRSAWSAWSAWSTESAESAWSTGSTGSAWSAWSALDYDFDWYVFEFEYCQNPNKGKLPNENDLKYLEYSELLMQAKEVGLGYRIEWEGTLYLIPTPLVKINARNLFHSDIYPAIRWKDGREFYHLNGVNFPEDLWKKVVSKEMPFEEILAIKDIDQRTQAMRYGDVQKFFEHTKSTLLDSSDKGNELWFVPQSAGIFRIDAYFLKYKDPSTDKIYMSGIDPEIGQKKDADLSMAWKHGGIPLEDYKNMKHLVHES